MIIMVIIIIKETFLINACNNVDTLVSHAAWCCDADYYCLFYIESIKSSLIVDNAHLSSIVSDTVRIVKGVASPDIVKL